MVYFQANTSDFKSGAMSKKFDRYLDLATDSTLVEPHWDAIIACFDSVRGGEVSAKPALLSIRRRLQHENPHVVQHTLLVLDACVKNCGSRMHSEIATREFMEDFKNLVTESKYDEVKNKALEMLQCWATAFANKPEYKMIVDTHNLMKLAGFDFPSLKEADAMFMAQVAPEWADGPECFRCRTAFSFMTRKHHCRACGQIFCDRCSQREMTLPQFGIEKEVRVCDACFETRVASETAKKQKESQALLSMITTKSGKKEDVSAEEKERILREREEEELMLALAISQSEAEAKESERSQNLYSVYNGLNNDQQQETATVSSYNLSDNGIYKGIAAASVIGDSPVESTADDPLARYLNRDYWQQKKDVTQNKVEEWAASAPPRSEPSIAPSVCSTIMAPDEGMLAGEFSSMNLNVNGNPPTDDFKARTDDALRWCDSIREQVTVMDNRIRSNVARGRQVINDTAIQDLFSRLTELHSQVLNRMHNLDEQRGYYESLQDHLASIGEARQAINELRQEHERQNQERMAEEQRQRQAQMQLTLEMMRMKKHAMLMEQREQALQRFQQQQQEIAMRRAQQFYPPQSGFVPPPVPGPQGQGPQYYGYPPTNGGINGAPPAQAQSYTAPQPNYPNYPQNSGPVSASNGVNQNAYYQQDASNGQSEQHHAQNAPQQQQQQQQQSHVTLQQDQHYAFKNYSSPPQPSSQYNYQPNPQQQNYNGQQQQYYPAAQKTQQQEPEVPQQQPPQQYYQAAQGFVQGHPPAQQQQMPEQPLISFD
ncbi:unnamed protein product [Caenorhabditis auriculariae]|uniref:Hepatocyte growth factor-regulated tyrosine kinase substrate n=1 Tax=Caenorhabditis auriculariae TaxID=2777116 RepID=A0A8S1HSM9_9PELO|nr:unnamed protein product [Caenorhabditis auriculariae]